MTDHKKNLDDLTEAAAAEGEAQLRTFLQKYGGNLEDIGGIIDEFRRLQAEQGTKAAMSIISTRVLSEDAKGAIVKAISGDMKGAADILGKIFGGERE